MKFNVREVEFDFDDDYANGFKLTFEEEITLRDLALGIWEADDEDDLIEEITSASGWCIKSIDYDIQPVKSMLPLQEDLLRRQLLQWTLMNLEVL